MGTSPSRGKLQGHDPSSLLQTINAYESQLRKPENVDDMQQICAHLNLPGYSSLNSFISLNNLMLQDSNDP